MTDDETLSHSFLLIHGGDDHRNILLIALSIVIFSTMMIMMNRQSYPIPSMHDIFTYIWLFLMVKYGKCRYIYPSPMDAMGIDHLLYILCWWWQLWKRVRRQLSDWVLQFYCAFSPAQFRAENVPGHCEMGTFPWENCYTKVKVHGTDPMYLFI